MALTEIIGPVMVGPSSSHTAGAVKLGNIARRLWGDKIGQVDIFLRGSFAATYWGHGTDRALLGGLMGWYPDDRRIKDAYNRAKKSGLNYHFYQEAIDGAHPNSVRFMIKSSHKKMELVGASTGGGSVCIQEIDHFPVNINGELAALIFLHQDRPGIVSSITTELFRMNLNIAEMSLRRKARGQEAMMVIEMDSMPDRNTLENLKNIDHIFNKMYFIPSIAGGCQQ